MSNIKKKSESENEAQPILSKSENLKYLNDLKTSEI
jgi:hypothetical protein